MRKLKLYSQMTPDEKEHYEELMQLSIDIEKAHKDYINKLEELCKAYAYELAQVMYRDMVEEEGDDRK